MRNARAIERVYAGMRLRKYCLPLLGYGALPALAMIAVPQAVNNRKPPAPPAHYTIQGAIPMPADRADDSYAIYEALMPGKTLASLPSAQGASWAIAQVTVNDSDRNPAVPPQGQLKPPPENARGFEEAVADYQTNRYIRISLVKDAFQLNHAFALLSPEDVASLRAAKTAPDVSSETQSQWSAYPGVTFFSEVYFDTRHRAALVYENDWCAHLCGAGSWLYLEKQGDRWVQRSGIITPGA